MTEKNEFNQFLPDENSTQDKQFVEIPAEQPIQIDRIPSGFDPMGEVELRGRVASGLAGGQVPWWILIAGWIIFGATAFLLLHAAIATSFFTVWLFAGVALIPLFLLGQGTRAKLSDSRRRNR